MVEAGVKCGPTILSARSRRSGPTHAAPTRLLGYLDGARNERTGTRNEMKSQSAAASLSFLFSRSWPHRAGSVVAASVLAGYSDPTPPENPDARTPRRPDRGLPMLQPA